MYYVMKFVFNAIIAAKFNFIFSYFQRYIFEIASSLVLPHKDQMQFQNLSLFLFHDSTCQPRRTKERGICFTITSVQWEIVITLSTMVWYGIILYGVVQCGVVWYGIVYCMAWCRILVPSPPQFFARRGMTTDLY